jgi:hypothetical protein
MGLLFSTCRHRNPSGQKLDRAIAIAELNVKANFGEPIGHFFRSEHADRMPFMSTTIASGATPEDIDFTHNRVVSAVLRGIYKYGPVLA